MSTIIKIVGVLLLALAAFVWISHITPLANTIVGGQTLSFSPSSLTAGALATHTTTLPTFSTDGVLIIDASTQPGVPYLVYQDAKGNILTKELLFDTSRGCNVEAGELPCAPGIGEATTTTDDVAPLPSGTPVHINGAIDLQAVRVVNYTTVPQPLHTMVLFPASVGSTVTLSNGLALRVAGIQDSSACVLGVGCYGNGVPRVSVVLTAGKNTTSTQLVPGHLFIWNRMAFVLTSIQGTNSQAQFTFLAVQG